MPFYLWSAANQATCPNSFSFCCFHLWTPNWVHQGAWGCVKIVTKLVVEKEDKGFNMAKCWLIDDMLGNEFLSCFSFGNELFPSVSIDVHCFQVAPPNIVYHPILDIHKDEIQKKSHNIISLTPKCPFLHSPRTCIMLTISLFASWRSGRIFRTISF